MCCLYRYCFVDMHDLHMCQKWQWWFMHIYVYIQYVHGLWIFKTFNHRSSYWTKTNTLTKCNRTILSTVQVPVTHTYIIYIILNNASILYIAYRASYVWTFTMQYLFVCFCNVVQLVRITRPTESKVAIWAVDVQAISLQQFVILAASFPGKSPGCGRFVRKAGSDSVSVWNIILYWDRSQHDEIRRGDINTP